MYKECPLVPENSTRLLAEKSGSENTPQGLHILSCKLYTCSFKFKKGSLVGMDRDFLEKEKFCWESWELGPLTQVLA